MLFTYLFYLLRLLYTLFTNLLKKLLTPPDYVLFTLHGPYTDLRQPPEGLLQRRMSTRVESLQELAEKFQKAANDSRVKGLILNIGSPMLTLAQIQSLSATIREIRASGKTVIAWATGYNSTTYYLAAACDRILIQKGGVIYTLGFTNRQLYMKNTLDRCGIELDVVQVSPYKSALERFARQDMSDQVREMTEWLLDSYYGQFKEAITAGRKLSKDKILALIEGTPLYGEEALEIGAVDGLVSAEDLSAYLGLKEKPARLASWDECSKCFPRPLPALPGRYIALLRVQGNIIDGKSYRPPAKPPIPAPYLFNEQTGDLSFVQQARRALKDRKVKAVLLYIDSGGGSAASSEAMTSILNKVAAKKPLVAMMGSIAGSGGYYVATPASHIVAQPATITGSIGVIAAKVVNTRLLEKLLLNRETITKGQKELFSPEKPFTEEEREKALGFIFHIYELFVKRVSDSRSLQPEEVKKVGGGKVWTGKQALAHGLVDELGGLETALSKLREMAKLPQNTPLVEVGLPRRETAPLSATTAWLEHAMNNLGPLAEGKALMLSPLSLFIKTDINTHHLH